MNIQYYKIRNSKKEFLYRTGDMRLVWIEAGREHKFYDDGLLFTKKEIQSTIFNLEDGMEFSIHKVKGE